MCLETKPKRDVNEGKNSWAEPEFTLAFSGPGHLTIVTGGHVIATGKTHTQTLELISTLRVI